MLENKLAMNGVGNPSLYKLDVAVTYRCNAKCKYCKIWKLNNVDELTLEDYEALFDKLNLSWLHLTGGEPFLRKDFHKIVTTASEKMDLLIIDTSTNGILTKKITKQCEKILSEIDCRFEVGVSIDGIECVHDKLRGVKSWERALKTYQSLKSLEAYENFGVHLNHMLSPENLGSFDEFLKEMGRREIMINDISIEIARNSPFFRNEGIKINFGKEKIKETLAKIIELYKEKGQKTFRERLRLAYLREMVKFINDKGNIPCTAGWVSCFLDPSGFLYPCSMMKNPLGNVRERSITELFQSERMKAWRRTHRNCRLCWSGCEGIVSLVQNFIV